MRPCVCYLYFCAKRKNINNRHQSITCLDRVICCAMRSKEHFALRANVDREMNILYFLIIVMFTYEKIENCPYASSYREHYKISFDDGNTIIMCKDKGELQLAGSYEKDIKSTKESLVNRIKQIEICYILTNIFNITYILQDMCTALSTSVEFDDDHTINYYKSQYLYYSTISFSAADDIYFTNIYDLLDFLRKKYQHLLKPVKLAIDDK